MPPTSPSPPSAAPRVAWHLEPALRRTAQVRAGLDEDELRALLMTQPRALGDPAMRAASERAFGKLMAALPSRLREQAAAISERLHIDPTGWHASTEDLSMLPIVQDAVARDCRLTFDYTRADGQTGPRTVDPLGLVSKGIAWYLVARAPNGFRTYRVSRMRAATPLAQTFERPANFKLSAYWETSTAAFQDARTQFDATIAVDPQAARSLRSWCVTTPSENPPAKSLPETWQILRIRFESEEHARFLVLGFGPRVRVLEPVTLREKIHFEANALLNS